MNPFLAFAYLAVTAWGRGVAATAAHVDHAVGAQCPVFKETETYRRTRDRISTRRRRRMW